MKNNELFTYGLGAIGMFVAFYIIYSYRDSQKSKANFVTNKQEEYLINPKHGPIDDPNSQFPHKYLIQRIKSKVRTKHPKTGYQSGDIISHKKHPFSHNEYTISKNIVSI